MVQSIEVLVEGGKATPGPPLGPQLGPLGVNIPQVIKEINEKTKDYAGMQVPVKISVDPKTKQFTITVGTPPTSALIKKEIGVEKGSGNPKSNKVGDLNIEQIKKIARMKIRDSLSPNIEKMVMEVLGTCVSMGVTVEGQDPREIQKKIMNKEIKIEE
ncbi:MAG: 50S ribosomal protein L11 [Thermoplasmata archaeon]